MKFNLFCKLVGVVALLACGPAAMAQTATSTPKNGSTEVWVMPNAFGSAASVASLTAADWNQIFDPANEQQWQQVLTKADVFSFFPQSLSTYTPAQLQNAVALFNKYHIKIAVELGGTLEGTCTGDLTTVGARSAAIEMSEIAPIYKAGGTVSYISLDNPTSRVALNGRPNNCQFQLSDAITQLIQYLKAVKVAHPEIKPGLIVNLPLEIYNGTPCVQAYYQPGTAHQLNESYCFTEGHGGLDYKGVFDSIMSGVRAAGLDIYYQHADNPYGYIAYNSTSNVLTQRLIPLEQQTESYGIPFGLIHNTGLEYPGPVPSDVNTQDQEFHDQTLQSVTAFRNAGGNEGHLFVESWYAYPHKIMPETTSSPPTFMYTVLGAISAFNQPLTCSPATVANGTVAAAPGCAITCNSGYSLSGTTCVAMTCSPAAVANGTVAAAPGCGITCNSGYSLSGTTCVAKACSPATVANGTVAAAPGCAITCKNGYSLSGTTCVAKTTSTNIFQQLLASWAALWASWFK